MTKFDTGQLVFTRGVMDELDKDMDFRLFVFRSLGRHIKGDWGDLCAEDKRENDFALDKYLRILSAYEDKHHPKLWIITEADRSTTTVLFPEEY